MYFKVVMFLDTSVVYKTDPCAHKMNGGCWILLGVQKYYCGITFLDQKRNLGVHV